MDEPTGTRKFERQEGESAEMFALFVIYRDLAPAERSAKAVARRTGLQPKTVANHLFKWSWRERAEAWDDEQDRLKREAMAEEIKAMGVRHAQIAVVVQQKVVERLTQINAADLTPSDTIKWLEIAVRIERQARGVDKDDNTNKDNAGAQIIIQIPDNGRGDSAGVKRETHIIDQDPQPSPIFDPDSDIVLELPEHSTSRGTD